MNLRIKFLIYTFILCSPFLQGQSIDSLVTVTVDKAEVLRKSEGDYEGAIELLTDLLEELEGKGYKGTLAVVSLYHKIGVNYYYYGELQKAQFYAKKALEVRLQEYGEAHLDVVRNYIMLGAINKVSQDYEAAKNFNKLATVSMEQLIATNQSTDTLRLMKIYGDNIRLNAIMKNTTTALLFWEKSYSFYSKNKAEYGREIAILNDDKGNIYLGTGDYTEARSSFQKAASLFRSLSGEGDYRKELAITLINLAFTQAKLKNYAQAMANNLAAIRLYQELVDQNDYPDWHQKLNIVYTNLVELTKYTQDYTAAETYFQKGLHHNNLGYGSIYNSNYSELHRNKAEISLAQNKLEEAQALNQKALQALVPSFKTDDPLALVNLEEHAIKDKLSFLATLKQKAGIFRAIAAQKNTQQQVYLEAAYQNYQTLDKVITQIRQSYNATGSQFELIEQTYPIYEKAIQTALQLFEQNKNDNYLEAAYQFAAKNKALVLLSGMQEEQAKNLSTIPAELLEEEKTLKQSIYQLESKLYDQASADNTQLLKDSLFNLQRTYQKLIQQFEETYTGYYNSKYGFDKKVPITQLQQQLPSGACIVEYFVGEEQLFVFTITKGAFDYVALDKIENFEEDVLAFRRQIEARSKLNDSFTAQSFQLYQYLLQTALTQIKAHDNLNHLIIIPDGVLLQLPFDVLLQDRNSNLPNYLLRNYSISYAYSNHLLFSESKGGRAPNTFAGFGLEYDDYTLADLATYVDNPLASIPLTRALGKLQYSDNEVQEIATLLTGDLWLNEAATRQAFLDHADQYAILHLAAHGLLNEAYPLNSALVFTKQNDTLDYFLRAADLYNMELNADMVVLSACNTGAGVVQKGEGVRSLARAFSYAGCPGLVASLWSASDKSTKEILVDFYKNLQEGKTKNEAMRQAKLAYLNTTSPAYQLPFYWAHLSVIGDADTLSVFEVPWWKRYWFLGVLIGIGLLVVSRYKNRH